MYAIIDATAFDRLAEALEASRLQYVNLFSNEMAAAREHDAPYLVWLRYEERSAWKPILRDLRNQNAGICFASKADFDDLRRHWKKWLSVKLAPREDFVMFRFYDPRILFAFIVTLSASEAAAFFGPVSDIFGFQRSHLSIVSQNQEVQSATPIKIGVGGFVMSPTHLAAFEEVVSETFQQRVFDYFRVVWPAESAFFTDEELREQLRLAIEDAKTFGSVREGDIISVMNVRILRPDIRRDEWIWEQVMNHESNNPKWRSGVLEGYLTLDFRSLAERQYYDYQRGRFYYDNFAVGNESLRYLGEVFPNLFLRHRR